MTSTPIHTPDQLASDAASRPLRLSRPRGRGDPSITRLLADRTA